MSIYCCSSQCHHIQQDEVVNCRRNMKKGHAASTRENHRSHHKAYLKFCTEYEFHPYPGSEWRYCQYAQYLHEKSLKPGTIQNHISSIKVMHKMQYLPTPPEGHTHYKLLSQSFQKARKEPVKQATPINHKLLLTFSPMLT